MLPFAKNELTSPKTSFTYGLLPLFVDAKQPPTKRKPFSTVISQNASHTIDMILPAEILEIVQSKLSEGCGTVQYAKVIMSLHDLISGDFFNEYVKKGNVMMLSEGRPGIDQLYSLYEGVLRIEVDKPTYERAGLPGNAVPDGGLKHKKNRFAITINLRQPSMLHGKKGFERLVWATKNVLNESVTWLFHDLQLNKSAGGIIDMHHPSHVTSKSELNLLLSVKSPNMLSPAAWAHNCDAILKDREFVSDLEEWLSLVALASPRINSHDKIDSFLSRYAVPRRPCSAPYSEDYSTIDVAHLRWHGYHPPSFVIKLLIIAKKFCGPHWVAFMVHGFRNEAVTILKLPSESGADNFMEWEHRPSF